MPPLADGERQLRVIHNHFHVFLFCIENGHARDLGGAQGVRRKLDGVLTELDDVDLLATKLANDALNAHTLHADTSAHAVDITVTAEYRDLGTLAGLACATLDHNCVVVNLRHFLLKQTHYQFACGTRHNDARVFSGLLNCLDDNADAVADAVALQLGLLFSRESGFCFPEIDDQVSGLNALDHTVCQFPNTPGEFSIDIFALSFANLLQDHLFSDLGGDAAHCIHGQLQANFVANLRGRKLVFLGLVNGPLVDRIFYGLNDLFQGEHLDTQLGVDFRNHLAGALKLFPRTQDYGIFDGVKYDLRLNAFFLRKQFNRLIDRGQCSYLCPEFSATTRTSSWLCRCRLAQQPSSLQGQAEELRARHRTRPVCR